MCQTCGAAAHRWPAAELAASMDLVGCLLASHQWRPSKLSSKHPAGPVSAQPRFPATASRTLQCTEVGKRVVGKRVAASMQTKGQIAATTHALHEAPAAGKTCRMCKWQGTAPPDKIVQAQLHHRCSITQWLLHPAHLRPLFHLVSPLASKTHVPAGRTETALQACVPAVCSMQACDHIMYMAVHVASWLVCMDCMWQ